jgi:phosphoribosylformimino-5-aminoimidazole carboxamide ribotide isomerase
VQVIPVIDLMGGQVVRGVGGRRDEYRAITSIFAPDAQPASIADGLASAGFRETYVADLDAIAGSEPAWSIYAELVRSGLDLWVDAGLSTAEEAQAIARFEVDGRALAAIVAGLESLPDPNSLAAILAAVGPQRLIFSLDLRAGVPLIRSQAWEHLSPLQIATIGLRMGVQRMIVLDLAKVGMGHGVGTEPLCRAIRSLAPAMQIIAGGGVRSADDLRVLKAAGCNAALVASALHDGRLTPSDLNAGQS